MFPRCQGFVDFGCCLKGDWELSYNLYSGKEKKRKKKKDEKDTLPIISLIF